MRTGTASAADRSARLQRLAAALGDAMGPDDVARATLTGAQQLPGVVRAALAVSRGAGRELDFVSTDDDSVSAAHVRWCQVDGLADVPVAEALRTGRSVLLPSLDALAQRYPQLVDRQRSLGTRSLAAVPLTTGDTGSGALLLAFDDEREFDADEQSLLESFAAQVTQALRRGLAFQAEQSISERLQRSLLPQSLPELPHLALGAYYRPGGRDVDVGGDWYDVLPLPDGAVALALGDVMGKGVPAAIVMGEVRAATRAYALLDPRPEVVLDRLDRLVTALGAPERLVTLAYGVVADGVLTLALAGHPPPLLIPATGLPVPADVEPGPPLGLSAGPWPTVLLPLPPGGAVLAYSDGLVESRSQPLDVGLSRLGDRIAGMDSRRRNPRELCAALGALVGEQAGDDVTMLAVGLTPRDERTASRALPAEPRATPMSRQFLGDLLEGWGLAEDVVATAQLCVSELVTNAVIHSGTAPRVTARLDDERLLVLVQDRGSSGSARPADPHDLLDVSGRGLALVEALAAAWSAENSADGTTVWFELEVSRREPGPPAG